MAIPRNLSKLAQGADTSGVLGVANGGTGTSSTTFVNLTSNVSGTLPIANGGTGLASVGTSGNVLTSNGTAWISSAPAGGGSWVYLSTVTANNVASADIETTFNSTYDMYAIVMTSLTAADANQLLAFRLKIGGSYRVDSYNWALATLNGSTYSGQMNANTSFIGASNAPNYLTTSGILSSGIVFVPNPSSTSGGRTIYGEYVGSFRKTSFSGNSDYEAALTGVRVILQAGNNFSGTFRLYGIKNS